MTTKSLENAIDKSKRLEQRVKAFQDVLNDLSSTDDKKKLLWKEVYENAINDRENASMLFTDAWTSMQNSSSAEHTTLGSTLTKYLERMCKSNSQLLSLAELIAKAEEREAKIDPDDLFASISDD